MNISFISFQLTSLFKFRGCKCTIVCNYRLIYTKLQWYRENIWFQLGILFDIGALLGKNCKVEKMMRFLKKTDVWGNIKWGIADNISMARAVSYSD